jgi:restriction system protein
MSIPDYQAFMKPVLQFLADGKEHPHRECALHVKKIMKLSEEDVQQLLPSGQQTLFANRIGWARTYLSKAGLISVPKRGHAVITEKGKAFLKKNPPKITSDTLKQFPEFLKFVNPGKKAAEKSSDSQSNNSLNGEKTPEEELEAIHEKLKTDVEDELLVKLKESSPEFFEKTVVDVLLKMGYGGSKKEAGMAIGRSGDEGIDGVISEDRLGLDKIYIQAKRWSNVVGRPVVQAFAGALQGKKARKGVIITTSHFAQTAYDFVNDIDNKIVLIDGRQLVRYMTELDIGVETAQVYKIKRIDSDYFED